MWSSGRAFTASCRRVLTYGPNFQGSFKKIYELSLVAKLGLPPKLYVINSTTASSEGGFPIQIWYIFFYLRFFFLLLH